MTTDPSSDVVERVARVLRKSREINCSRDDAERLAKAAIEASGYLATIERLSAELMQLREALDAIMKSAIIGSASDSAETKQVALESIDDIAVAALSNTAENGRDVLGDDWEDHCGEPGCEMCPRPA